MYGGLDFSFFFFFFLCGMRVTFGERRWCGVCNGCCAGIWMRGGGAGWDLLGGVVGGTGILFCEGDLI